MTVKIFPLTECPFCDRGTGGILLDVPAVDDLFDSQAECDSCEDIHHKLLIHNSPRPDDAPCPHLVWMTVEVSRGGHQERVSRYEGDATVDWECPAWRAITDETVVELLEHFLCGLEHEDFLPKATHEFDRFQFSWGCDGDKPHHVYDACGKTAFAEDVPAFIANMTMQAQRLQTAWAAGRDTHGEWREVLRQREREMEYEYEEC